MAIVVGWLGFDNTAVNIVRVTFRSAGIAHQNFDAWHGPFIPRRGRSIMGGKTIEHLGVQSKLSEVMPTFGQPEGILHFFFILFSTCGYLKKGYCMESFVFIKEPLVARARSRGYEHHFGVLGSNQFVFSCLGPW